MTVKPMRRFGSDSGAALIEFALILPVLLFALAMLTDIGFAVHRRMQVQRGVAAGSYWAAGHMADITSSNAADYVAKVTALVGSVTGNAPDVTVLVNNGSGATNADTFYCVDATTGALASTGSTSTSCPDGTKSGKFVLVRSRATYTPMFPKVTGMLTNLLVGETTTVKVK